MPPLRRFPPNRTSPCRHPPRIESASSAAPGAAAWSGFRPRRGAAPDARPRPRDAFQLARAGPDRPALPRSLRRVRRADARSRLARRRRWPSPSTGIANWWTRFARPPRCSARAALELHVGDARAFIASGAARFRRDLSRSAVSRRSVAVAAAGVRRSASRPAASSTPRRHARSSRPPGCAPLAPRQGGAGALSSFPPGGRCRVDVERAPNASPSHRREPHAHRRLSRHVRPLHPRSRGPRAPRGEALRPGDRRGRRQRVEAAVSSPTAERVAMAREVLAGVSPTSRSWRSRGC